MSDTLTQPFLSLLSFAAATFCAGAAHALGGGGSIAEQQVYLKASNTDGGDEFGGAVALSGATAVVGARAENSAATGVDGDQSSDDAPDSGAAYVFVRNGIHWSQQAYLKASNTGALDDFGSSVAVSGDTVAIGAKGEASAAIGVGGDESDDSLPGAGAVYVFVRTGSTWTQQAYLKASSAGDDGFGHAVAIDGDRIVVGAPFEDSGASGVNGDGTDDGSASAGAAYVFVRDGDTWSQEAYLKASNTGAGDAFGTSVSISGDTVVVGARFEDSDASGVGGDGSSNAANNSGAAYVFVRDGSSWSQEAYLKASNTDPGDRFGTAVSVWDDLVVVGAPSEDSGSSGVNGDESDNSTSAGAAYVFRRSGSAWSQEAYLKASTVDPGLHAGSETDAFGSAVAAWRDLVVVGDRFEDSNTTGVDGNQANNVSFNAGAAYAFGYQSGSWSQLAYLKASNTDTMDVFGQSVAVSGTTVLCGAPSEDSLATGIDGNQANDNGSWAGAAYAFDVCFIAALQVTRAGTPPNPVALLPGQTSGPVAGAIWDPVVDHTSFLPEATGDLLLLSRRGTEVDLGPAGTLLCDLPFGSALFNLDAGTPFLIALPDDCSLVGVTLCAQAGSADDESFLLTNALDITVGTHE